MYRRLDGVATTRGPCRLEALPRGRIHYTPLLARRAGRADERWRQQINRQRGWRPRTCQGRSLAREARAVDAGGASTSDTQNALTTFDDILDDLAERLKEQRAELHGELATTHQTSHGRRTRPQAPRSWGPKAIGGTPTPRLVTPIAQPCTECRANPRLSRRFRSRFPSTSLCHDALRRLVPA